MLLMLIAFLDRESSFRQPALMPMGGLNHFVANIQKRFRLGKIVLIVFSVDRS